MTAFRSQTDAMLAAKYDPEPWRNLHTGQRASTGHADLDWVFDPRPEFIPSRYNDPFPRQSHTWPEPDPAWRVKHPEPNPILTAVRESPDYEMWNLAIRQFNSFGGYTTWDVPTNPFHVLTIATYEQIEHARKVLTRLAALS